MANPFALDMPPAQATGTATATFQTPVTVTSTPAFPAAGAPASADPFDAPAPREARGPRIRDMYGRLLLIIPHKLEEGVRSNFKDNDGNAQTQDRMTADVIVLDGGPIAYGGQPERVGGAPHDKTAEVPLKNTRQFISNAGLISQCRQALAKKITTGQPGMVLGRLQVGEAKGGNNAPYLLAPPTEQDKAIARQYLATVDPFA